MSSLAFIAFGQASPRAWRWLRRVFYDDWSLKLLALAVTLLLWFIITGHQNQVERDVTVEPRIAGTPAAGYQLREVIVTPDSVRVQGPEEHVNALHKLPTKTISIDGRRESFDVAATQIEISDPEVDTRETVKVHIEIAPFGPSQSPSRETN